LDVLLVSTYILIVIRSAHSKRTVRQKLRILHLLLRGLLGVVHALIHITIHCVHGIDYIVIGILRNLLLYKNALIHRLSCLALGSH